MTINANSRDSLVWIAPMMLGTCLLGNLYFQRLCIQNMARIDLEAGKPFSMLLVRAVVTLLMRGIPHFLGKEEAVFTASC